MSIRLGRALALVVVVAGWGAVGAGCEAGLFTENDRRVDRLKNFQDSTPAVGSRAARQHENEMGFGFGGGAANQ